MQKYTGTNKARSISLLLIGLLGLVALLLQLYVMMKNAASNEISKPTALLNFFSYFTILSNLLVTISSLVAGLFPSTAYGVFFSRHTIRTAITVYILIVGIIYCIALRQIWNPQGLQLIADKLLHDVIPVLYFIFWLLFTPARSLQLKDTFRWLLFPLAYLCFALIRGFNDGWYAYPFINIYELGIQKVTVNCFMICVGFLMISFVLVFINRYIKK